MPKPTEQVEIIIRAPWASGYRYQVVIEPVGDEQGQIQYASAVGPHVPTPAESDVASSIRQIAPVGFRHGSEKV